MSMIRVENLTFAYPSSYDNIFENVNFQIDTDWKLGFVGRNGRGKTTFLNLLLGKYEYHGKIQASVQFDYFPYPVNDKNRLTTDILSEVCPLAEEWELLRELSYLEVRDDVLWRPFFTLSNGEQTKVLLAALFLNDGHFLLIDEPTNHLDMKAREAVSAYLKRKKGFILVSHDRCFLDGCVDHILSINRSNIEVQSGNFSTWFTNFQRQQEFELAQNVKLKKSIAEANRVDESLFKAILRKMDFSRIQFEKKMEDFSAGQKKKVLIAKSLCEQAHLYVWDEPLNYIDIYSRMQIENLIREFSPTMIFVEHDLAFRNNIATKSICLAAE